MPDYAYVAKTKEGGVEKNTIFALNEKAAVDVLRSKGLLPVSVSVSKKQFDVGQWLNSLSSIKLLDKITFFKNLSVMIKAGLPVSRALKILAVQTTSPKLQKIILDVSRGVESGTSFSDSIAKYPGVFPDISVSMIRAGEASGNLEANLEYLSEQMRRDYDLISKARGAMIYPIVVIVALLIVGFIMFTFILPKLTETFKEFDVALPLTTRIVIGVVDIFAKYGFYIMGVVLVGVGGFVYWRKTPAGKVVVHKAVLYMPIISDIVKKINVTRFLRVFVSLIKSGMPMVEALEVSSKVVGNIYYQKVIRDAASNVKVGQSVVTAFKKEPRLFATLIVEMMEVGEESGTTDAVLGEVANFYEADVDQTMKNLSSILEPVLMMIIGAVVGLLAVALITPIYSIGQGIN
ncbi:MAG TPA: type II secretion system F family protein [Patescibacteria group bacterium]|nr:type II secretion system F family protein [Patescibacteria group bacterium]